MIIKGEYKGKPINIEIPDNEYWNKRNENKVSKYWTMADNLEKRLSKEYLKAYKELEKELYTFIGKYGKEGVITYSNSRIIALMKELKPYIDNLYEFQQLSITDHLVEVFNDDFIKTTYMIQDTLKIYGSFVGINERAIKTIISYPWSGDSFSNRIYRNKDKLLIALKEELTQGIIRGDSISDLSKVMAKRLDISRKSANVLVQTETGAVLTEADKKAYKEYDVEKYEYLSTLDSRTSEICRDLDGKVFNLDDMQIGVNAPPLHPNCFDKEVEIFTNNGWKYIKELNNNDMCLSFNPNNIKEVEYLKPKDYIKYLYNGNLINFKNKTLDINVTPNHQMIIKYAKNKNSKYRFVDAEKLPKSDNTIYRGLEWHDKIKETITFAGYEIETNLLCKFLAYYLADGSTSTYKRNESIKCNGKISQTDKIDLMYLELKELPFKIWKGKEGILFNDKNVCMELSKFGKCNEKYIPLYIKELGKQYIKTFLDAYSITDGHIKKGKLWGNYLTNDSINFFTTSKKLCDDLNELILKVGGRPFSKLTKCKGKPCFNGKYKQNFDIWIISWNTKINTWTSSIKRSFIPYNDYVYCVELPKWNTILVRQNGQILWTGNCRSTTIPYVDDEARKRIARRLDNNEVEYIPSGMSYREWEKKFIG